MIEAVGLCKAYGKQKVLNHVSFSLDKGRVMGILGPNGAGKTTLIKILALIARPDGGTLTINGQDAFRESGLVRPLIGYVPQDVALFEDLSVRDNLMCWSGRKGRKAKEQAARLIEELSMSSFASKRISALSGGMKRRVNLAVAMLDDPQVLIPRRTAGGRRYRTAAADPREPAKAGAIRRDPDHRQPSSGGDPPAGRGNDGHQGWRHTLFGHDGKAPCNARRGRWHDAGRRCAGTPEHTSKHTVSEFREAE